MTPGDNLSHLVVQADGSPTNEIRTEWRTDPDGNRLELVQWPEGHLDGMIRADFVPDE